MQEDKASGETNAASCSKEDSIVCYCHRVTTRMLKDAYREHGSLKGVEAATRAGTGCTGCKIILQSLFGEEPSDHYAKETSAPLVGTACLKPGHRTMKGFIIANELLESAVYSSNAVAPQLGDCDSTTEIEYALLDHRGRPVKMGSRILPTNETFHFDTREEKLERPFIGMLLLTLGRGNAGAARFNIHWSNSRSVTSTHEQASSGKPRTFIPLIVDTHLLNSPNTVYCAVMNPHPARVDFQMTVFDVDTNQEMTWNSHLPPLCTTWINATEYLYKPALQKNPHGRVALRIISPSLNMYQALSNYFFVHNAETDLWMSNHI